MELFFTLFKASFKREAQYKFDFFVILVFCRGSGGFRLGFGWFRLGSGRFRVVPAGSGRKAVVHICVIPQKSSRLIA